MKNTVALQWVRGTVDRPLEVGEIVLVQVQARVAEAHETHDDRTRDVVRKHVLDPTGKRATLVE